MAYSAVLELFGASERGRFDPKTFSDTCRQFRDHLERSKHKSGITWFLAVDRVYAQSRDEGKLLQWIADISGAGLEEKEPWFIRGVVVEGALDLSRGDNGWTTSSENATFAELQSSLRHFPAVGVRVDYLPKPDIKEKQTLSNLIWTAQPDLPYLLFTDVSPDGRECNNVCLSKIVDKAKSVAGYSKRSSRAYVSAIVRILLDQSPSQNESAASLLETAGQIDGIELAGLVLISRVSTPETLVNFPRLKSLVLLLQEKHAFPIGLTQGAAVRRYLKAIHEGSNNGKPPTDPTDLSNRKSRSRSGAKK
jgi:hypothetical protein